MEEPKPDQPPMPPTEAPNPNPNPNPDPNPPNTAPQTIPPPSSLPPPNNRKRPLDNDTKTHIQNSSYFKMRAVLKDLRPHFIEVLRTPDFQNCKAALEIREQMELLMDLYKEMTAEKIMIGKCQNVPGGRPSSGDGQDVKAAGQQPPPDKVFAKLPEPVLLGRTSEKLQPDGTQILGTYIIGGSAFGWNFITFPGNKAIYYGRTKEAFRAANVIPPP